MLIKLPVESCAFVWEPHTDAIIPASFSGAGHPLPDPPCSPKAPSAIGKYCQVAVIPVLKLLLLQGFLSQT